MKIHVDQDRCEGHGRCYSIAPELFEPDDIGNASARGDGAVEPTEEQLARRAAANCPEQAVIVEEG
jgi:ferredoxin